MEVLDQNDHEVAVEVLDLNDRVVAVLGQNDQEVVVEVLDLKDQDQEVAVVAQFLRDPEEAVVEVPFLNDLEEVLHQSDQREAAVEVDRGLLISHQKN